MIGPFVILLAFLSAQQTPKFSHKGPGVGLGVSAGRPSPTRMSQRAARQREQQYARQEALLRTLERLEQRDTQQAAAADLCKLVRDLDPPALSTLLHVLSVQTAKTSQFTRLVRREACRALIGRLGRWERRQAQGPSCAPSLCFAAGVPAHDGPAHHLALPAARRCADAAHAQQAAGAAAGAAGGQRQQVGWPGQPHTPAAVYTHGFDALRASRGRLPF